MSDEMTSNSNNFDVIVVGGGPSGSSTTAFLSKKGKSVLLLDKATFPRDKICGDALSGKTLSVLRELDLEKELPKLPHGMVNGVLLSSPKGEILDLPFTSETKEARKPGYVIRRKDADNLFFQNAKKLATKTIEGFTVNEIIFENDFAVGVKGKDSSGKEMEFRSKVVVGADGAYSSLLRKFNVERNDDNHQCAATRAYYENVEGLSDKIEIHFIKGVLPGYFWIFPIDGKNANVGLGMIVSDIKKQKKDLRKMTTDVVENHPMFKARFANSKLVGPVMSWQLPFGSKQQKLHGNGFVLVGDAAALIDPFSGEGVGNALLSGKIAAEAINNAIDKGDVSAKELENYKTKLWSTINNELQTSYMMQRMGKIQPLLNLIIHKASTRPKVREAIIGMLENEEAKKDLITVPGLIKLLIFN